MHPITYKLQNLTEEMKSRGYPNSLIRNYLKEYLQDIILYVIYSDKKYKDLNFYGGTCLRKIYNLNRLSEDLDFESNTPVDLKDLEKTLIEYFKVEKFNKVSSSIQENDNIKRCTLKFEILKDLELSENTNEKLHVKVEINENSEQYDTEYTPYSKDTYNMLLKHYTQSVLMSSKMLACANRVFKKGKTKVNIKGRDYYDLIWYMQNNIIPNKDVFKKNNTTHKEILTKIDDIVLNIKPKDLILDLEPLLENSTYIIDWANQFHTLYEKYRTNY